MDDEFKREVLTRLQTIEDRLDALDKSQAQLQQAYARSRAHLRRLWLRPPMWTFEQHPPRPLDLRSLRIIHGKGTGALRERVTEMLHKDTRVKGFRSGAWNEGGAGVTVADLS